MVFAHPTVLLVLQRESVRLAPLFTFCGTMVFAMTIAKMGLIASHQGLKELVNSVLEGVPPALQMNFV